MSRVLLLVLVSVLAVTSIAFAAPATQGKAELRQVINGPGSAIQDPARAGLARELGRAKALGQTARVAELEAQLGATRDAAARTQGNLPAGIRVVSSPLHNPEDGHSSSPLWVGGDILVHGSEYFDVTPSLATDGLNRLFCAFEVQTATGTEIRIEYSYDYGQTWNFLSEFYPSSGYDLISPSIAIGEGNGYVYLLLAFVDTALSCVHAFRRRLDTMDWDGVTIETNVLGICNPQIATDAREYTSWYPYLVYNSKGVDSWKLRFSRSTSNGLNWSAPVTLTPYSGSPNAYSGYDAYPDVEFGSSILYVAFDDHVEDTTVRDVYLISSADFGLTWSGVTALATTPYDESSPRLGAVKAYDSARTVMMCYNKYYGGIDWDVWYAYTQDGGSTWNTDYCLACYSGRLEAFCDVATSFGQGRIHAAYHDQGTVRYTSSPYDDPSAWSPMLDVSSAGVASVTWPRPAVDVIAGALVEVEAGIAWTDERSANREVYFDGGSTDESGVDTGDRILPDLSAMDCHPNPFEAATVISFSVGKLAPVKVDIYDVSGRRVRSLMDSPRVEPGEKRLNWDGRDDSGQPVGPGIYFLRITTPEAARQGKVVVLR